MNPVDLDVLQTIRTYPCVSVLLTTEPSIALARAEAERLDALIDEASRRLTGELDTDRAAVLVRRLGVEAAEARTRPTRRALALFANEHASWTVTLAVPVRDRVVIDDTFATRDLVEHVNRSEPYWVLTISEHQARLYLGDVERVRPIEGRFPIVADRTTDGADVLRRAARALDEELTADAMPLVVMGVERTISRLQRVSGRAFAGRVLGNHDHSTLGEIHALTWPTMARVLAARQATTLGELDRARDHRRLATGISEVWSLGLEGRVHLIVAERGYEAPARLGERSDDVQPADDRDHPEVIDDLVDDAVEVVLARGGRAVFVDDGTLRSMGRVAAVLRF